MGITHEVMGITHEVMRGREPKKRTKLYLLDSTSRAAPENLSVKCLRINRSLPVDSSRKDRPNRMIQFAAYSQDLPDRLDQDVINSSYKNKTQYSNVLLEKMLSIKCRFQSRSCLDELVYILDLYAALPTELFEEIVDSYLEQQKHFNQMPPSQRLLAFRSVGFGNWSASK